MRRVWCETAPIAVARRAVLDAARVSMITHVWGTEVGLLPVAGYQSLPVGVSESNRNIYLMGNESNVSDDTS